MNAKKIPFRYNVGEAIIEPFWDPAASGLAEWKVVENGAAGVKVNQYWCYVPYEWLRTAPDGTGAEIRREYEELCMEGYDALVLSAVVPQNGFLRLTAETELGVRSVRSEGEGKKELRLPLEGSKRITAVTIAVGNTTGLPATGWINWLGAQKDKELADYLSLYKQYDETWESYLVSEEYEPKFEPEYGLLVTKEELAVLRKRYEEHLANGGRDVYYENIKEYLERKPEDMISDYARMGGDIRYCRARDEEQYLACAVPEKLVQYALLKKDKYALRLAARYAMSLLMTTWWLDGFLANYPQGLWEHSGFVPSLALGALAAVLDGAGEILTDKAKRLIKKQMMEKGLSKVNSVVWRYDSIFRCNQLAWYSYGRMSAYAILLKDYERVIPYIELAKKDIENSMSLAIAGDGSADEGISYFLCQPGNAGGGLFWYARARNRDFRECLPKELFLTADYIDALSSTRADGAFLTICDYHEPQDLRGLAIMAYALPESLWVNAYHKKLKELGGLPNDFIAFLLDEKIPKENNPAKTFVRLSETGYVSSFRADEHARMKVFVMGNKAGAGHNHEDKGSFILEYNDEAFFVDPGMISYGDAQSRALKMCDYHNMLLPTGTKENPHPKNPLPYSYSPQGFGSERELHLVMDMTDSFENWYGLWKRSLDSDTPDEFLITDTYRLKKGTGVVMLLNTWLPVREEEGCVLVEGANSVCRIPIPEGTVWNETVKRILGKELHQIGFYKAGRTGMIRTRMKFEKRMH